MVVLIRRTVFNKHLTLLVTQELVVIQQEVAKMDVVRIFYVFGMM
jgi:hypothetical protein